jgi:hypothetical protein
MHNCVRWLGSQISGAISSALMFIFTFAGTPVTLHAQVSSGGTTARFNKAVLVAAAAENVQLKDEVAVSYTLTPTQNGTQVTLLCHYNGSGEGETSSRSYALVGTDQRPGVLSSSVPSSAVISSSVTLTQPGSALSVPLRVEYLLTSTDEGRLIVSITAVEVAE